MTSEQVCAQADCSYRQLDYWVRIGVLPGVDHLVSIGSGYPRDWTHSEAVFVAKLAQLVRAGINVRVASDALIAGIAAAHGEGIDAVTEIRLPGGLAVNLRPVLAAVASSP